MPNTMGMEEISSKDAREKMSDILNHVAFQGKHYTLTRNRKKMAVIIPFSEWEIFERILQKLEDEEDIRDAEKILNRIESGETKVISQKELERRLGL
jgi:PHD/YefM family antitoxin component YafN of YafNO toxin-antitoxin module